VTAASSNNGMITTEERELTISLSPTSSSAAISQVSILEKLDQLHLVMKKFGVKEPVSPLMLSRHHHSLTTHSFKKLMSLTVEDSDLTNKVSKT
jgi:hypothetical protein